MQIEKSISWFLRTVLACPQKAEGVETGHMGYKIYKEVNAFVPPK